MQQNVCGADRTGRLIIGIVLLLIGLFAPLAPVWKTIVLVLAAVALVTAVIRFCPANAMFGINTCKPRSQGVDRPGA